jgi:hypothetical protein
MKRVAPSSRWSPTRPATLIAAVHFSIGPSQDYRLLEPAMLQAAWNLPGDLTIDRLIGRRRVRLGGQSPPVTPRPGHPLDRDQPQFARGKGAAGRPSPRKWARTRYRRQMYRRFHHRKYGQRWQAESAVSRFKRRLGFALRVAAPTHRGNENRTCVSATHDLMLLAAGP